MRLCDCMTTQDKIALGTLLVISATCFALGLWIRRREVAACKWPQVRGKIVTSRIVTSRLSNGETTSEPVIEYEFEFQGLSFKSSHWRVGNYTIGNLASAQEVTDRYPVGSFVTVYVNARQSRVSILETRPSSLCWVPFGFGIFSVGVFILVVVSIILYSRPFHP